MNDPSFRKAELNTTGLPEPFELEYFAFVEDYDSVELNIHKRLGNYRPNKSREFFTCSIPEAILTIRKLSNIKYEEVFYKSPEKIQEEINRERQKRQQAETLQRQALEKKEREAEKLRLKEVRLQERVKEQAFDKDYDEAWSQMKDEDGNPRRAFEFWEDAVSCAILSGACVFVIWFLLTVIMGSLFGLGGSHQLYSEATFILWLVYMVFTMLCLRTNSFDTIKEFYQAAAGMTLVVAMCILVGRLWG